MPFVPLTPEEQRQWEPPCTDREHSPPNMMVITHPMKWVCPSCGASVILYPQQSFLKHVKDDVTLSAHQPSSYEMAAAFCYAEKFAAGQAEHEYRAR